MPQARAMRGRAESSSAEKGQATPVDRPPTPAAADLRSYFDLVRLGDIPGETNPGGQQAVQLWPRVCYRKSCWSHAISPLDCP